MGWECQHCCHIRDKNRWLRSTTSALVMEPLTWLMAWWPLQRETRWRGQPGHGKPKGAVKLTNGRSLEGHGKPYRCLLPIPEKTSVGCLRCMNRDPKIECGWCNSPMQWCNAKNVWQMFCGRINRAPPHPEVQSPPKPSNSKHGSVVDRHEWLWKYSGYTFRANQLYRKLLIDNATHVCWWHL